MKSLLLTLEVVERVNQYKKVIFWRFTDISKKSLNFLIHAFPYCLSDPKINVFLQLLHEFSEIKFQEISKENLKRKN